MKFKNIIVCAVPLLIGITACSNYRVEIPITKVTESQTEEISEEYSLEESTSQSEILNNSVDLISDTSTTLNSEDIDVPLHSDEVRVCKNVNFDKSNKIVSLYKNNNGTLEEMSLDLDRTRESDVILKYKYKDDSINCWVYISTNGEIAQRPWEEVSVTNELLATFTPFISDLSGDGYTGNFTQLNQVITNEEGIASYQVYNDTYIVKYLNDNTILHLHLTDTVASQDEMIESIITNEDIIKYLEPFTYVNTPEDIQIEYDELAYGNSITIDDMVVNSNNIEQLGLVDRINEAVVTGGSVMENIPVDNYSGVTLRFKNNDVISKSIKQCDLLSLQYEFNESEEYNCVLFGYLNGNSSLSDIDMDIRPYDNYFIDENGTGYVVYDLSNSGEGIKAITTYYIKDRLSSLVIEFLG